MTDRTDALELADRLDMYSTNAVYNKDLRDAAMLLRAAPQPETEVRAVLTKAYQWFAKYNDGEAGDEYINTGTGEADAWALEVELAKIIIDIHADRAQSATAFDPELQADGDAEDRTSDGRRRGHSKLVYNKVTRTIDKVDPYAAEPPEDQGEDRLGKRPTTGE